jgi:UDP-glucose 4-epimerase
MKKILITGANGYIGARLALYLAKHCYEVTVLCYPEAPVDKFWTSLMSNIIIGDIRDEIFLVSLSENYYDTIIHLVSLDHHQSNGKPSLVSSINITPTWTLLDIFSKKGLNQFVYFSTVHVYGLMEGYITEEYNPSPTTPYALTHLLSEQICEYYNRTTSVKCSIVRLSNSYGSPVFRENNCWWLVINDLCRMAYVNKEIVLKSDGTPLRDFIHGNDVCQAIELIIRKENSINLFHISSGQTLSIYEMAILVHDIFLDRYNIDISIEKSQQANASINKYNIGNNKLKSIGFKAEWDLTKGINDLFDYLALNDRK